MVRPEGLVVAATINRFAGLHDTLARGLYFDAGRRPSIDAAAGDGWRRPGHGPKAMFTMAYLHTPEGVPVECADPGPTPHARYGLEGAAWPMGDIASRLGDPQRRTPVLAAMRRTESVPSLLGVSGHLLTAGTRTGTGPGC